MSAADISAWARDVRRFEQKAPGQVIDLVDRSITARLKADTGGDGVFSRGRNLGRATTQITRRNGEASVEPAGSHGVWGILQGGTSRGVAAKRTFTVGAEPGLDAALRQLEDDWAAL